MNPGTLSLRAAYEFGAAHGLETEVNAIRDLVVDWDRSYTSSLRQKHGIFDEFKQKHWPFGNTSSGGSKRRRFLRIKKQYDDFLAGVPLDEPEQEEPEVQELLFPVESHLRDFIAANLDIIKVHGAKLSPRVGD